MLHRVSILASLCALLAACSTSGHAFDPDKVPQITPGSSTQADVQRIFGHPTSVRTRGTGGSTWIYDFRETVRHDTGMLSRIGRWISVIFGGPNVGSPINVEYKNQTHHRLSVFFDSYGVVSDYNYERTDKPSKRVY